MSKTIVDLHCYCCGIPLLNSFDLVFYLQAGAVDRVFVMSHEHSKRVDGATVVHVKREKPYRPQRDKA